MKQETFTNMEYNRRKKKTKRDEFLEILEGIIPWGEWVDIIAPYYSQGKRGRPLMGIEKMLRMYLLQIWFHLSDPATEDATIINAPSSTKNAQKARDPEMHRTKKGNDWRFGMKCHVGVDGQIPI